MKKLLFLIFLSVVFSQCKEKEAGLRTYKVIFSGEELDITGASMVLMDKADTVRAINDTIAYKRALMSFYSNLIAEELTDHKVYNTKSFQLTDTLENEVYLSQAIKDSLETEVKKLSSVRKVLGLRYTE